MESHVITAVISLLVGGATHKAFSAYVSSEVAKAITAAKAEAAKGESDAKAAVAKVVTEVKAAV